MSKNECLAAVATALQLSTFEVIFLAFKIFRFDGFRDFSETLLNVFDISAVQQVFYKK